MLIRIAEWLPTKSLHREVDGITSTAQSAGYRTEKAGVWTPLVGAEVIS